MNSEQVTISKNDLQVLVKYAQRYTIGRMTYAPWIFNQITLRNMDNLTDNTIHVVIRNIEREFALFKYYPSIKRKRHRPRQGVD